MGDPEARLGPDPLVVRWFSSTGVLSIRKVDHADYHVLLGLRWLARVADHVTIRAGLPGCILAVRVVR